MARRLPPRGQRAFEEDAAGRVWTYRYDDAAGAWVRTPAGTARPGPGDRILVVDARGTPRAEQVGRRGEVRALPLTRGMLEAAAAMAPVPPSRTGRAPRLPPPPAGLPAPPRPPREPRRRPRRGRAAGAAAAPPEAPQRLRRSLPPPGQRRFEVDAERGVTYVYRLVKHPGRATPTLARTLARGAVPGPGDQVLTLGVGGEVTAHEVTARGRRRRIDVTDRMAEAATALAAGAGLVVEAAGVRLESARARAIEDEQLRRAARFGYLPRDPDALREVGRADLADELEALAAEAEARGVPIRREAPRAPAPRRGVRGEVPGATTLFQDLGIAPADVATRGEPPRPGLREAAEYVVGALARPVARATLSVDDVYRTAGQETLLRALQGDAQGLRARLDPRRAYRVQVTFDVASYQVRRIEALERLIAGLPPGAPERRRAERELAGIGPVSEHRRRFQAVAGDATPAEMAQLVAWAIYHETGPTGWIVSAGRRDRSGFVSQEAIDSIDVQIELFEV